MLKVMKTSIWSKVTGYIRKAETWYLTTPDRALDEAYDAALMIQAIENEHFSGQKIAPEHSKTLGQEAFTYFDQEREKYLKVLRLRLTEFRSSRSTLSVTNPKANRRPLPERFPSAPEERSAIVLEKLKFIDQVLARYQTQSQHQSQALVPVQPKTLQSLSNPNTRLIPYSTQNGGRLSDFEIANRQPQPTVLGSLESISDKTGVLPRSILGTINRLKRDLDPEGEVEAIQDFQVKQMRTKIAMRFMLMLIAIPLLIQLSVRNFALSDRLIPGHLISQRFAIVNPSKIFINSEMTEEAMKELAQFEERLKFENIVKEVTGQRPLTPEIHEERIREKVDEIATTFSHKSSSAIKNWIADLAGVIAFIVILTRGKAEMQIVKDFIDEVSYGLSDSAKAFVIILFTDVFVGFHSPHGWEVLLEGIAQHFGLAANRSYISLFIATFPVILDTIFKYWIFRYLNRISPSAVATYKEMNE
jgi:CemA family